MVEYNHITQSDDFTAMKCIEDSVLKLHNNVSEYENNTILHQDSSCITSPTSYHLLNLVSRKFHKSYASFPIEKCQDHLNKTVSCMERSSWHRNHLRRSISLPSLRLSKCSNKHWDQPMFDQEIHSNECHIDESNLLHQRQQTLILNDLETFQNGILDPLYKQHHQICRRSQSLIPTHLCVSNNQDSNNFDFDKSTYRDLCLQFGSGHCVKPPLLFNSLNSTEHNTLSTQYETKSLGSYTDACLNKWIYKGTSEDLLIKRVKFRGSLDFIVMTFNSSGIPNALKLLQLYQLIDITNPINVASFLFFISGLDKQLIGHYISSHLPFHTHVLKHFLHLFCFTGIPIIAAIRLLFSKVHPPGESQQLFRIVNEFATAYVKDNPIDQLVIDEVSLLTYAIVMLHTDKYNSRVRRKMSKEEFINLIPQAQTIQIKTHQSLDGSFDFPKHHLFNKKFLEDIYDDVTGTEFKIILNETDAVYHRLCKQQSSFNSLSFPYQLSLPVFKLKTHRMTTSNVDTVCPPVGVNHQTYQSPIEIKQLNHSYLNSDSAFKCIQDQSHMMNHELIPMSQAFLPFLHEEFPVDDILKFGTTFIKHCRNGSEKLRVVKLSQDGQRLHWFPLGASRKIEFDEEIKRDKLRRCIWLEDILDVTIGTAWSPNFRKHRHLCDNDSRYCSIHASSRILDLCAPSDFTTSIHFWAAAILSKAQRIRHQTQSRRAGLYSVSPSLKHHEKDIMASKPVILDRLKTMKESNVNQSVVPNNHTTIKPNESAWDKCRFFDSYPLQKPLLYNDHPHKINSVGSNLSDTFNDQLLDKTGWNRMKSKFQNLNKKQTSFILKTQPLTTTNLEILPNSVDSFVLKETALIDHDDRRDQNIRKDCHLYTHTLCRSISPSNQKDKMYCYKRSVSFPIYQRYTFSTVCSCKKNVTQYQLPTRHLRQKATIPNVLNQTDVLLSQYGMTSHRPFFKSSLIVNQLFEQETFHETNVFHTEECELNYTQTTVSSNDPKKNNIKVSTLFHNPSEDINLLKNEGNEGTTLSTFNPDNITTTCSGFDLSSSQSGGCFFRDKKTGQKHDLCSMNPYISDKTICHSNSETKKELERLHLWETTIFPNWAIHWDNSNLMCTPDLSMMEDTTTLLGTSMIPFFFRSLATIINHWNQLSTKLTKEMTFKSNELSKDDLSQINSMTMIPLESERKQSQFSFKHQWNSDLYHLQSSIFQHTVPISAAQSSMSQMNMIHYFPSQSIMSQNSTLSHRLGTQKGSRNNIRSSVLLPLSFSAQLDSIRTTIGQDLFGFLHLMSGAVRVPCNDSSTIDSTEINTQMDEVIQTPSFLMHRGFYWDIDLLIDPIQKSTRRSCRIRNQPYQTNNTQGSRRWKTADIPASYILMDDPFPSIPIPAHDLKHYPLNMKKKSLALLSLWWAGIPATFREILWSLALSIQCRPTEIERFEKLVQDTIKNNILSIEDMYNKMILDIIEMTNTQQCYFLNGFCGWASDSKKLCKNNFPTITTKQLSLPCYFCSQFDSLLVRPTDSKITYNKQQKVIINKSNTNNLSTQLENEYPLHTVEVEQHVAKNSQTLLEQLPFKKRWHSVPPINHFSTMQYLNKKNERHPCRRKTYSDINPKNTKTKDIHYIFNDNSSVNKASCQNVMTSKNDKHIVNRLQDSKTINSFSNTPSKTILQLDPPYICQHINDNQTVSTSVFNTLNIFTPDIRQNTTNSLLKSIQFCTDTSRSILCGVAEICIGLLVVRPDIVITKQIIRVVTVIAATCRNVARSFYIAKKLLSETSLPFSDMAQINNPCSAQRMFCRLHLFQILLYKRLPLIFHHFKALEISPDFYILPWFGTLFVGAVPLVCLSRIWDRLILGGETIVFQIVLGLLRYYELQLLTTSFEGCLQILSWDFIESPSHSLFNHKDVASDKWLLRLFDETRFWRCVDSCTVDPSIINKWNNLTERLQEAAQISEFMNSNI